MSSDCLNIRGKTGILCSKHPNLLLHVFHPLTTPPFKLPKDNHFPLLSIMPCLTSMIQKVNGIPWSINDEDMLDIRRKSSPWERIDVVTITWGTSFTSEEAAVELAPSPSFLVHKNPSRCLFKPWPRCLLCLVIAMFLIPCLVRYVLNSMTLVLFYKTREPWINHQSPSRTWCPRSRSSWSNRGYQEIYYLLSSVWKSSLVRSFTPGRWTETETGPPKF